MVAPLAKDPAVQEEVSRRITNAVFEQLKVKELTTQTLDAIAARPRVAGVTENLPVELSTFAEPISNAIYGFTAGPGEQARGVRAPSRTPGSPPTARRTPAWSPR